MEHNNLTSEDLTPTSAASIYKIPAQKTNSSESTNKGATRKLRSYSKTLESMSFYKEAINLNNEDDNAPTKTSHNEQGVGYNVQEQKRQENIGHIIAPVVSNGAGPNIIKSDDPNYLLYPEYCKLYFANIMLTARLKQLMNEKEDLEQKLSSMETTKNNYHENGMRSHDHSDKNKKRHRRTAGEISRHYKCPNSSCSKSYGSEGSLNQHLKLKHLEYYYSMEKNNNQQSSSHINHKSDDTLEEVMNDRRETTEENGLKFESSMIVDDIKNEEGSYEDINLMVDSLFIPGNERNVEESLGL